MHARPDPRGHSEGGWLSEQLRNARHGQPVTLPAWMLDGHTARADRVVGAIPQDRALRAAAYAVGPDDSILPAV
ncbi:hypothetical protein D5S18_00290 [Nocardia panacis]|uniref:Uncharacterized protein n=1 Tax=Nocardia panacis TaxID=2340916 RepID=A0A3A4KXH3_9NOCA|nr:hypothetical protein D5S18_00290 [Nocardia panacis]